MGKKWNRRAMTLGLGAAAALLTGCFASDGLVTEEADLVFRNDSGAAVSSVQLSGASECQGGRLWQTAARWSGGRPWASGWSIPVR